MPTGRCLVGVKHRDCSGQLWGCQTAPHPTRHSRAPPRSPFPPPIVVLAKAETQGRRAARGRLRLSPFLRPPLVIPANPEGRGAPVRAEGNRSMNRRQVGAPHCAQLSPPPTKHPSVGAVREPPSRHSGNPSAIDPLTVPTHPRLPLPRLTPTRRSRPPSLVTHAPPLVIPAEAGIQRGRARAGHPLHHPIAIHPLSFPPP